MMKEIIHTARIRAKQSRVYRAFAEAKALREWLCDHAFTQPHGRGRYWMRWEEGHRVEGHYIHVMPGQKLVFTWRALGAPGQTTVRVSLKPLGAETELALIHSGFAVNAEWNRFRDQCQGRWETALENLKSVLETGIDLRKAQRPYLGIRWRVAPDARIQVTKVLGGHGAQTQGFQGGDVLLKIGEHLIHGYPALVRALEDCHVGEPVEVHVLRDEREEVINTCPGSVTRSERTMAPRNILAGVRDHQIQMQRRLRQLLRDISEEQAEVQPSAESWSIKDILAHLSVTERDLHHRLAQIVMRSWDDTPKGDPAMLPEALAAVRSQCETVTDLLARFEADQAESLAFLAHLRSEICDDKARYRRLAEVVDMWEHTCEHVQEIEAVLETVRAEMSQRQEALERVLAEKEEMP
jgi:uncharacterized protein YndB with AHSA1/START domain/ribosomal 50S subunit-associated protein YjgA (DUF615 family)